MGREHGAPKTLEDLQRHECIRYRFPNGRIYAWELEENGKELLFDAPSRLVVGEQDIALRAAIEGIGPVFVFESAVAPHIEKGELVPLLDSYCPDQPSFQLYYPRQRRIFSALHAFIDVARDFHRAPPE